VAPAIEGVVLDDGATLPAHQMVQGGPSVLYDAVAVVVTEAAAEKMAGCPAAKDFVAHAHVHAKFIGFDAGVTPLFAAAGVEPDDGYFPLTNRRSATAFVQGCRPLRYWDRAEKA
jgi:catalase